MLATHSISIVVAVVVVAVVVVALSSGEETTSRLHSLTDISEEIIVRSFIYFAGDFFSISVFIVVSVASSFSIIK